MNTIHGHKSKWKLFSSWFRHTKRRGVGVDGKLIKPLLQSIGIRKPSKERVMETIEEYILHETLSFLTADELLDMSCLSRRFREMVKEKKVWKDLAMIYFNVPPLIPTPLLLQTIQTKKDFYAYLRQYPHLLAKARVGTLFFIEGRVYDVPSKFTEEHPGGDAILLQFSGGDATREFVLAAHSPLTLEVAESFVIWPHPGRSAQSEEGEEEAAMARITVHQYSSAFCAFQAFKDEAQVSLLTEHFVLSVLLSVVAA